MWLGSAHLMLMLYYFLCQLVMEMSYTMSYDTAMNTEGQ